MAVTTEEILRRARELGDLVAQSREAQKLEEVVKRLQADIEAQRAMNDYNRHAQALAEKEAQGKPIEVADKKKLESLQVAVMRNGTLSAFQVAQMDYLDLMRAVDRAIEGEPAEPPPGVGMGAGVSPVVNPDLANFT